jgi:hypothetical protein
MRRFVRWLLALCVMLVAATAGAQTPSAGGALDGALLPRELDALGAWVAAHDQPKCTEHCFVLQRMTLTGSIDDGLAFELEGSVLAKGAVAIPLFGPPSQVRLEKVTEDGKPAAIGFESDHYFAYTASKHFLLKGNLGLPNDRALVIVGPLNTLEANLSKGGVVEGAKLSGLASTTIHFQADAKATETAEPPVFQLSRAIRVQRETTFEWRLVLRAGTDLGVVRMPLTNGEKVLDVNGVTGWHVEGTELVLPTAGRSASIVITGTLEGLGTIAGAQPGTIEKTFANDPRSTYEWWQIEADPEHRVTVGGDAKQLDGAESPFPRTPASRLFLVGKGQSIALSVETLSSIEALAAVIHQHDRMLVLTDRGELVSDESITYENNGIDYLRFTPAGRPIFLASDGLSQRILHDMAGGDSLLIALRKGMHSARVQTLSQTTLGLLGGRLVLPSATYPLTASRAQITIGLPRGVHPVVLFGGDRAQWFVDVEDAIAVAAALVLAWLAFKTRSQRALAFVSLATLWVFSHPVFLVAVAAVIAIPVARLAARLFARGASGRGRWAFAGIAGLLLLVGLGAMVQRKSTVAREESGNVYGSEQALRYDLPAASNAAPPEGKAAYDSMENDKLAGKKIGGLDAKEKSKSGDEATLSFQSAGEAYSDLVTKATIDGVTPVALPLPRYERAIVVSRELVTEQRPFRPTLVYVTDATLLAIAVLGVLATLSLVYLRRADLLALRDRIRALLAERPTPAPLVPDPAPAAPPAE